MSNFLNQTLLGAVKPVDSFYKDTVITPSNIDDSTYVDILKYKPETYGAVGDGTTNDTQAISDCLTNAGKCYLSVGKTYLVDFWDAVGITEQMQDYDSTKVVDGFFDDYSSKFFGEGTLLVKSGYNYYKWGVTTAQESYLKSNAPDLKNEVEEDFFLPSETKNSYETFYHKRYWANAMEDFAYNDAVKYRNICAIYFDHTKKSSFPDELTICIRRSTVFARNNGKWEIKSNQLGSDLASSNIKNYSIPWTTGSSSNRAFTNTPVIVDDHIEQKVLKEEMIQAIPDAPSGSTEGVCHFWGENIDIEDDDDISNLISVWEIWVKEEGYDDYLVVTNGIDLISSLGDITQSCYGRAKYLTHNKRQFWCGAINREDVFDCSDELSVLFTTQDPTLTNKVSNVERQTENLLSIIDNVSLSLGDYTTLTTSNNEITITTTDTSSDMFNIDLDMITNFSSVVKNGVDYTFILEVTTQALSFFGYIYSKNYKIRETISGDYETLPYRLVPFTAVENGAYLKVRPSNFSGTFKLYLLEGTYDSSNFSDLKIARKLIDYSETTNIEYLSNKRIPKLDALSQRVEVLETNTCLLNNLVSKLYKGDDGQFICPLRLQPSTAYYIKPMSFNNEIFTTITFTIYKRNSSAQSTLCSFNYGSDGSYGTFTTPSDTDCGYYLIISSDGTDKLESIGWENFYLYIGESDVSNSFAISNLRTPFSYNNEKIDALEFGFIPNDSDKAFANKNLLYFLQSRFANQLKILYFPSGTYFISYYHNIITFSLIGEDKNSSIIKIDADFATELNYMFILNEKVSIKNLTFKATDDYYWNNEWAFTDIRSNTDTTLTSVYTCDPIITTNAYIFGLKSTLLQDYSAETWTIFDDCNFEGLPHAFVNQGTELNAPIQFKDCTFLDCQSGLRFNCNKGDYVNNIKVINCEFIRVNRPIYYSETSTYEKEYLNLTLTNCKFKYCNEECITLASSSNVTLDKEWNTVILDNVKVSYCAKGFIYANNRLKLNVIGKAKISYLAMDDWLSNSSTYSVFRTGTSITKTSLKAIVDLDMEETKYGFGIDDTTDRLYTFTEPPVVIGCNSSYPALLKIRTWTTNIGTNVTQS